MKIIFTKKENGRISATNFQTFKSHIIDESLFIQNINSKEGLSVDVFELFSEMKLYARIDGVAVPVLVVRASDGIKLMFKSDSYTTDLAGNKSINAIRMYIEDGDCLYTNLDDVEVANQRQNLKKNAEKVVNEVKTSTTKAFQNVCETLGKFADVVKSDVESLAGKLDVNDINSTENDNSKSYSDLSSLQNFRKNLVKKQMNMLNDLKKVKKQIAEVDEKIADWLDNTTENGAEENTEA